MYWLLYHREFKNPVTNITTVECYIILIISNCLWTHPWHDNCGILLLLYSTLCRREFRGPVTNLTSLEGYIILTIGNRLETHQWTGSSLQRTAFFDAPILIASLNVVKSFILFGDVHKGIYFVQYRDQVCCCKEQHALMHLSWLLASMWSSPSCRLGKYTRASILCTT